MSRWMIKEGYDTLPNTWNVKKTFIISIQKRSDTHNYISYYYLHCQNLQINVFEVCGYWLVFGQISLPLLLTIFWKDDLISYTNTSWIYNGYIGIEVKINCFGLAIFINNYQQNDWLCIHFRVCQYYFYYFCTMIWKSGLVCHGFGNTYKVSGFWCIYLIKPD